MNANFNEITSIGPKLIPSILYWGFTCISVYILINIVYFHRIETFFKLLFREFISSFVIVACSMENGFIRKYYGDLSFLFTIFVFSQILSFIIPSNAAATPCKSFMKFLNGDFSSLLLILSIMCQTFGGYAAHLYNRNWCSLGYTELHKIQFSHTKCSNLLVPVLVGCFFEFSAVLSDNILRKYLSNKKPEVLSYKFLYTFINILSLSWIAIGVDLTGMFGNPINASAQTFWCDNSNVLNHIIVYWISPLLAVWLVYGFRDRKQKVH